MLHGPLVVEMRNTNLAIKRLFDIFGSVLGLIALSPIFLVVPILIKIVMPGPVFFKQERVGYKGIMFNILKFRSMKVDKEAEDSHDTARDYQRLTTLGNIIRRTKVDELPQLINVLKGDMSLVGPRPTFKEQVEEYTEVQKRRLDMRPGMTGLAQVNGNITLTWEDRIKYDLNYIDNFSVILDIKILLKTILVIIFGEDKFKEEKGEYL